MAWMALPGRDVWVLATGYLRSQERWSASAFLTTILALNVGLIFINLLQNLTIGALFTAIDNRIAATHLSNASRRNLSLMRVSLRIAFIAIVVARVDIRRPR